MSLGGFEIDPTVLRSAETRRYLVREIYDWAKVVWPSVDVEIFGPSVLEHRSDNLFIARYGNLPPGGLEEMEATSAYSVMEAIAGPHAMDDVARRVARELVQPLIDTVEAYRGFMAIE